MRHYRKQTGYVLLITLLLIVIVGVSMIGVCRRSLCKALQANQAQEDIQRRWGMLSCQAAILPQADNILHQAEEETDEPLAMVQYQFDLGSQTFYIVLSDEQAKVNVNNLYRSHGRADTTQILQSLIQNVNACSRIYLQPSFGAKNKDDKLPPPPSFECFGQIFSGVGPSELIGDIENINVAVSEITCWGNGKINFRRAGRDVFLHACHPLLNSAEIERLVNARDETPGISLGDAITAMELPKKKKNKISQYLTDNSSCHSLWIIAASSDRMWYRFSVQSRETVDNEKKDKTVTNKISTFAW